MVESIAPMLRANQKRELCNLKLELGNVDDPEMHRQLPKGPTPVSQDRLADVVIQLSLKLVTDLIQTSLETVVQPFLKCIKRYAGINQGRVCNMNPTRRSYVVIRVPNITPRSAGSGRQR